jgi:flagellar hook-associated protein 1
MATGILGSAVSGLMAFQRSLDTTSHNIANVNTEGYSRQRVELGTMPAQFIGSGYVGNGVKIENIARSYDQFITNQLRSSASAFGDADRYAQLSSQVDNLLADPTTGMAPVIKSFFNSVNDVADDPSSVPARQVMVSEAEILTQRFSTMNGRFDQLRSQVNQNINVMVESVNSLATEMAELNRAIAIESGRTSNNQLANDLMDERDRLLTQLAEIVDFAVVPAKNNMLNIFIGQGQPLVLDGAAAQLQAQPDELDSTHIEIGLQWAKGNVQIITSQLAGGQISGTLRFRDEVLDPAQLKLGAVAASIAMEFNLVHANDAFGTGNNAFDLDGNPGEIFFTGLGSVPVTAHPANTGEINVIFDAGKIGLIDASDYQLNVSGPPDVYTLTRTSDDSTINLILSGSNLIPNSVDDELPGISIALGATPPVPGDSFLIRPAYYSAQNIKANITDPRKIAAATNVDADGVSVINGPMPGDNRNALSLAGLEHKSGMYGGKATFNDTYGRIVSEAGALTNAARVSSSAQETLFNNAKDSWQNISGVNLDEEAANLIKFQQSYQAAAQLVAITNTLFDSLLNGIR